MGKPISMFLQVHKIDSIKREIKTTFEKAKKVKGNWISSIGQIEIIVCTNLGTKMSCTFSEGKSQTYELKPHSKGLLIAFSKRTAIEEHLYNSHRTLFESACRASTLDIVWLRQTPREISTLNNR
jgi:hypothetical protein